MRAQDSELERQTEAAVPRRSVVRPTRSVNYAKLALRAVMLMFHVDPGIRQHAVPTAPGPSAVASQKHLVTRSRPFTLPSIRHDIVDERANARVCAHRLADNASRTRQVPPMRSHADRAESCSVTAVLFLAYDSFICISQEV
jgi:hypothetical protein